MTNPVTKRLRRDIELLNNRLSTAQELNKRQGIEIERANGEIALKDHAVHELSARLSECATTLERERRENKEWLQSVIEAIVVPSENLEVLAKSHGNIDLHSSHRDC